MSAPSTPATATSAASTESGSRTRLPDASRESARSGPGHAAEVSRHADSGKRDRFGDTGEAAGGLRRNWDGRSNRIAQRCAWHQRRTARRVRPACRRPRFSSLGTIDRIAYDNYEPLTALAAAAAVTERIGLCTSVLLGPLRPNAAELAKQALSLNALSGGRFTLGVGLGAREDDYEASGVDLRGRSRRLDEMLERIKEVWAGEDIGPAAGATPGLLVGGGVEASFARAARFGDGWIAGGSPNSSARWWGRCMRRGMRPGARRSPAPLASPTSRSAQTPAEYVRISRRLLRLAWRRGGSHDRRRCGQER